MASASFAQRINNNDPSIDVVAVAGWHNAAGSEEAVLWECSGDCTVLGNWSATILNNE